VEATDLCCPVLDNNGKAVSIEDEERVTSQNSELVGNGYIEVEVRQYNGYIHVKHLEWREKGHVYKILTEDTWWKKQWTMESSRCSIRVSVGENNAEALINDGVVKERAESIYSDGYTYISLNVGKPKCGQHEMCHDAHFTIAYAARMEPSRMNVLQDKLEDILKAWTQTTPQERPFSITYESLLKFFIKDEDSGDYIVGQYLPLIKKTGDARFCERDLEQKLASGDVQPPPWWPATFPQEKVFGIVSRDKKRLQRAKERAQGLQKHEGILLMHNPRTPSPELFDLLEHLAEIVYHFRACHYTQSDGKYCCPPFTHHEGSWHCSFPGQWMKRKGSSR